MDLGSLILVAFCFVGIISTIIVVVYNILSGIQKTNKKESDGQSQRKKSSFPKHPAQKNLSVSEETIKADISDSNQRLSSEEYLLPVGTLLQGGRYKIIKYLASGGFGNTYVVEHTILGTQWAMKEFYMRGINTRIGVTVAVSISENRDIFHQMKDKFLKETEWKQ